MEYKAGLLKLNKNNLKGKKWYHQRFDGAPYLISAIADNELRDEVRKRRVGGVHTTRICFFENDRADWYLLMDDIEKTTNTMLRLSQKERHLSKALLKQWEADDKTFYRKCKIIEKTDLSKLSDEELMALHDNHYSLVSRRNTSSSIIDGFALGSDNVIADIIMTLLKKRGLQDNYPELFSKLTAPAKQSFINEAEISLLEVAKKVEGNKQLTDCVINNSVEKCIALLKKHPKINKVMREHIKNYFWSKNNYVMAHYLDEKHFMEEIQEMLKTGLDINAEMKKISTTPARNRLVKMELIKKLKIDPHLKNLLVISEDFTYWQDERKKASYWNAHISTLLLNEIAKRTNYTLHELKYMVPVEVSQVFSNPIPKKEVKERMNGAFVWINQEFEPVTNVETLKKFMFGEHDNSKITEFTGLCASVGKVVGKVKVCMSSTEVGKMEKGDILVAIMTRPDYVIGMKKAAAIVTNEGGVTSHAAIVSRELGIPCVIGTKIATEVLKDGDIVEVDANNGIVKKV